MFSTVRRLDRFVSAVVTDFDRGWIGDVTCVALPASLVLHAPAFACRFCIIPEHAAICTCGALVGCGRDLTRRNYLSGTYLESIRLKEAKSTVVVNNRVASAATIS